jgi:hypothetical protein
MGDDENAAGRRLGGAYVKRLRMLGTRFATSGVGRPAVRYLLRSPNCSHWSRLGLDIPPIEGGLATILAQHRDGARVQRKMHTQVQVEP